MLSTVVSQRAVAGMIIVSYILGGIIAEELLERIQKRVWNK